MPSHLVDLLPELQLKIIGELLTDTLVDNKEVEGITKEEENDYNAPSLEEKKERKTRERKQDRILDLRNWSCTSHSCRNLLAPYIFKTVFLCNNEKSGSSATAISKSNLNELVKELIYVGSAPGDAHREEKAYSDTAPILPESVDTLLSDLGIFPNLETLSIEFPYHFADAKEWDEGLDLCEEEEQPDADVETAEETIAWRALMAKTYQALSRNKMTHLKALEIRQLVPKMVSTFNDPSFHEFLGQIERFSLSIYGEDNGAGWQINKVPQYCTIMSKLDGYFFDHLNSVTDLILKAPEEGPLGLDGMNHIPLPLKKDHMPSLKSIYLEYIFLGPDLLDFLTGHTKTLESLTMRKCFGSPSENTIADNGIHWSDFLDSLHNAKFQSLRRFDIVPDPTPLVDGEFEDDKEDDDEDELPDEVKEAREILANDGCRRVFAYASLDDKYGEVYEDDEENLARFQSGEDQASYEKLMGQIKANAAKEGGKRVEVR